MPKLTPMAGELFSGTVVAANVVDLDTLGAGDLPGSLVEWLRVTLGDRLCFALMEGDDHRSTVILDPDRTSFAKAVSRLSRAMDHHVGIPLSFGSAVIDRWPQEWVGNRAATLRVEVGVGGLPHLYLSNDS